MDSLFSKTINSGDRTYFADVNEAKAKYITIAETKPAKEGEKKFSRTGVMAYENHAEKLHEAFAEAMKLFTK